MDAGAFTVSCFGPGSGVGDATLFEITNKTATFPSSFGVTLTFADASNTDYGLILCDANGSTIPCVDKPANPVDFSGSPTFGANDAVFTFSNFTGNLDFYVNEAATITDVGATGKPVVPEPRNTAVLGLVALCALGLLQRFRLQISSKLSFQHFSLLRD